MHLKHIIACALILGMVDQISDGVATVEYEVGDNIYHSQVSLDLSACQPAEGQWVYFYKDYKIVTCVDKL